MVPNAGNLVGFEVKGVGFIAGVDSGDPVSHESFKSNIHTALNGLALAIIQSTGKTGAITITGFAKGLEKSMVIVQGK